MYLWWAEGRSRYHRPSWLTWLYPPPSSMSTRTLYWFLPDILIKQSCQKKRWKKKRKVLANVSAWLSDTKINPPHFNLRLARIFNWEGIDGMLRGWLVKVPSSDAMCSTCVTVCPLSLIRAIKSKICRHDVLEQRAYTTGLPRPTTAGFEVPALLSSPIFHFSLPLTFCSLDNTHWTFFLVCFFKYLL